MITNPTGSAYILGDLLSGDPITLSSGEDSGATTFQSGALAVSPGLIADQVVTLITLAVPNMLNGRIRGSIHQDEDAASVNLRFGNDSANMDLDFVVPQDVLQPNSQWPFDVIVIQPVVQLEFTNGATDSSFFRAFITALPV